MTPLQHFQAVWLRASHLTSIHAFVAAHSTPLIRADEILRAEWAARVSALDLYIHELVAQNMVAIFEGRRPAAPGYLRFPLTTEVMSRIAAASGTPAAASAFDLAVREKIARETYQFPDDIAAGIRYFSGVELWNSVALFLGATEATKAREATRLKLQLTQIVRRRNKIVHEADLQPSVPRSPWPISPADTGALTELIEKIVQAVDAVVV